MNVGIADPISSKAPQNATSRLNMTTYIINCVEEFSIFEYQNLIVEIGQSIHFCFLGILFPRDTHGLARRQHMAFLIILADIWE